MKLKIGHVYPKLLNLYGDTGNITVFEKRLLWRGIRHETIRYAPDDAIDFARLDIVYIGACAGRERLLACEKLQKQKADLKEYIKDGGSVLAVCGGYQLLGHYYKTKEGLRQGVSALDIFTEKEYKRIVGNAVIKSHLFPRAIVGFENHNGRTYIGENKPLGAVITGGGNNGSDGGEGIIYKNVIGTYLHGPLLPKNPHLCDYILEKALLRRFGKAELQPLDDGAEIAANDYIAHRFVRKHG